MDIRTKLIFAFVATSLASMLLLGAFAYGEAGTMLRGASARQLDALASARAQDLAIIAEALREEVRLIQSRTNLRQQVAAYPGDPEGTRPVIQRIIDDAQRSVEDIGRITVYDLQGLVVASSGALDDEVRSLGGVVERDDLSLSYFLERTDGGIAAVLQAPLRLDDRRVGTLSTVIDVGLLLDISGNYEGLGETGEMFLAVELRPGTVTILNRLRHHEHDERLLLPVDESSPAIRKALAGEDGFLEDVPDYRGVPVWAAVRGLPDFPGGLVVKIDAEEELARVRELRRRLTRVALSVAALAILAGAATGSWLARPIRGLNTVVARIRAGEATLRADARGEDEVSFLAESFNRLMDEVQDGSVGPESRPDSRDDPT